MSDTIGPGITVCPGSGDLLDEHQVRIPGDLVIDCPRCGRMTLAEAIDTPADVETRYYSVRVHEARVTEHGVHGPHCRVATTSECTCGGRGVL